MTYNKESINTVDNGKIFNQLCEDYGWLRPAHQRLGDPGEMTHRPLNAVDTTFSFDERVTMFKVIETMIYDGPSVTSLSDLEFWFPELSLTQDIKTVTLFTDKLVDHLELLIAELMAAAEGNPFIG